VRDRDRLDRTRERLRAAPRRFLERRRAALDSTGGRLRTLSPAATVGRGYAIVRSRGAIVRDAATVAPGDRIDVELAAGGVGALVEDVRP
jgi:exodeoxyribonuclease VII large subunit